MSTNTEAPRDDADVLCDDDDWEQEAHPDTQEMNRMVMAILYLYFEQLDPNWLTASVDGEEADPFPRWATLNGPLHGEIDFATNLQEVLGTDLFARWKQIALHNNGVGFITYNPSHKVAVIEGRTEIRLLDRLPPEMARKGRARGSNKPIFSAVAANVDSTTGEFDLRVLLDGRATGELIHMMVDEFCFLESQEGHSSKWNNRIARGTLRYRNVAYSDTNSEEAT
jgi:hypothetical protein